MSKTHRIVLLPLVVGKRHQVYIMPTRSTKVLLRIREQGDFFKHVSPFLNSKFIQIVFIRIFLSKPKDHIFKFFKCPVAIQTTFF